YARVWPTAGVHGPPAARRMVETGPLAGPVVLQRLRNPGLDLGDPGLRRRVRREEFGLARAALRGHAHPEIARGLRMIAGARHVDQAEMVGLRFLQPAPRQEHADRRAGAEAGRHPLRRTRVMSRERRLRGQEAALHRELLA